MLRLSLPALAGKAQIEYLVNGDVAVVFGLVRDYTDAFAPAMMARVAKAVQKRRNEFSTGRFFALAAQRQLGQEPVHIESSQRRRPLWPDGLVGSISHTDRLGLVVLTSSQRYAGLGVDMELRERVTDSIAETVLTTAELQALSQLSDLPSPAAVIFSGKEAIYKAVNPLVGRMIGFEEVELDFDRNRPGRFTARYIGPHRDNRLMEIGEGCFEYFEDHVVTSFVLPGRQGMISES